MSLQRIMRETTSRQFNRWMAYLEWDLRRPTRVEWYLAQICLEVARVLCKHPKKLRLKHFILNFDVDRRARRKEALTPEQSKKSWMSWLKIRPKDKKQEDG